MPFNVSYKSHIINKLGTITTTAVIAGYKKFTILICTYTTLDVTKSTIIITIKPCPKLLPCGKINVSNQYKKTLCPLNENWRKY